MEQGNGRYHIRFQRDPMNTRHLWCMVNTDDPQHSVITYYGHAFCHPLDQFNKATGRRVALTHAIANLPREERRAVWQTWLAGRRGP